ncbi:MAG: hypothetical protein GXO75_11420 [Calditrichaeota bacterium]|nr:hypothetical protein [Calditrichota bacterium]
MISLILSYLAAAIIPYVLFFIGMRFARRRRFDRYRREYWTRQNTEALKKIRFWDLQRIPEPFKLVTELESLQTTLQTISLSVELGLLEFIEKNPGLTEEQIEKYLGFSHRQVRAAIEVLLASKVIKPNENGYAITEQARVYLLKESPFLESLPPPVIAKRFLKILKSGIIKGTANKWSKGKASVPEKWAMQQHLYSFPLGFALYDLGILQKTKNIVDVAGGTGAVCIALALMDSTFEMKIIELPASIGIAEKMISQYGLSDRIKCIGMDMFTNDWPENVDALLFTNIFHDWDDDQCQILSKKAFEALRPGGLILIQEALLYDDKPGPLWTAHWSMAMALFMQGRQFHVRELKSIIEAAGFRDIQIHPLLGYYSSLVGVKPNH